MPGEDEILYAQWTPNTNTPYIVEYYRQLADASWPRTASQTTRHTGTTDTEVDA